MARDTSSTEPGAESGAESGAKAGTEASTEAAQPYGGGGEGGGLAGAGPPDRPGGGFWFHLTLAQRFALMGGVVMLAGMTIIGGWVSQRIEGGVVRNTAVATALYMETFITPISQELSRSDTLSPEAAGALHDIFANTPLGERVVSFKIWKRGGRIVHASDPELIGRTFEPTASLRAAWSGQVMSAFDELGDEEDAGERAIGLPLLEIYSPIRANWSGEIIAVVEFYEVASGLEQDLFAARLNTWIMVGAVMGSMAALLFGIVASGSRTIGRQRRALEAQVNDLAGLAAQNDSLRQRVQRASSRSAELNEQLFRRISAELHDGPAQFLGFASLRLGSLIDPPAGTDRAAEIGAVRDALDKAMREIRDMCRGLALPDIDGMPLGRVVQRAIKGHCDLTGTEVALDNSARPGLPLDHSQQICAYRFVQEGLTNAVRHGGAKGQAVALRSTEWALEVTVSDLGPGFGPGAGQRCGHTGLGLAGLRGRVESLGGKFSASNGRNGGAVLKMTLPLCEG
ncbi:MAG: sensor histidine kinase [Alphaproteobacteria bacterium]